MYRIIRVFIHKRKFVTEIVPLWLKNRVHTGLCAEGGAYT